MCPDDDEETQAPAEPDEDEQEKDAAAETEEAVLMEEETGEELDPLDAYMEEVKEEVKKFNMGTMKGGNDKVLSAFEFFLCEAQCSCGSFLHPSSFDVTGH